MTQGSRDVVSDENIVMIRHRSDGFVFSKEKSRQKQLFHASSRRANNWSFHNYVIAHTSLFSLSLSCLKMLLHVDNFFYCRISLGIQNLVGKILKILKIQLTLVCRLSGKVHSSEGHESAQAPFWKLPLCWTLQASYSIMLKVLEAQTCGRIRKKKKRKDENTSKHCVIYKRGKKSIKNLCAASVSWKFHWFELETFLWDFKLMTPIISQ